ncbi:protein FAM49B [Acyrthosiphon pisum]|uniref:CYRIA/CYRIB Rac1 binding domain-containing protein n=1 Tax=Acyrthosiphon pisum TaxID=7029 RepID=A0A8R2H2C1_ACYPI|nr:protein FAM49B [Acyrthosiphon pisum]|eukprot:XP_016656152.1 PREDICTED: protein FAM49B-like [Acyrthosiphon pisum]
MELFDEVQIVLTEASDVLSDPKHYLGADQYIRAAINNPSAEQNALTWEALMPRIRTLRRFYFFSQKIAISYVCWAIYLPECGIPSFCVLHNYNN